MEPIIELSNFSVNVNKAYDLFHLLTNEIAAFEMDVRHEHFLLISSGHKEKVKYIYKFKKKSRYFRHKLIIANLLIRHTELETGNEHVCERNDAMLCELRVLTDNLYSQTKWVIATDLYNTICNDLRELKNNMYILNSFNKIKETRISRNDLLYGKYKAGKDTTETSKSLTYLREIQLLIEIDDPCDKRFKHFELNQTMLSILSDYCNGAVNVLIKYANYNQ